MSDSEKNFNISTGARPVKTHLPPPTTEELQEAKDAEDLHTLAPLFPIERAVFDNALLSKNASVMKPELMPGEYPWQTVINFYMVVDGHLGRNELTEVLDRKLVREHPRFRAVVDLDEENAPANGLGVKADEVGSTLRQTAWA